MNRPEKPVPCRLCGDAGKMQLLHDFGPQPVAGYLETSREEAQSAPCFELATAICETCGLVQQAYDNARDLLVNRVYSDYQPTYSMSEQVRCYMDQYLDRAINASGAKPGDIAVEIGSNDGQTLAMIGSRGLRAVGFEPSCALAEATRQRGGEVIGDYFGRTSARAFLETHPPARLILTRHTLEHAFDPLDFLGGIAVALAPEGMAAIEVPYLRLQMMTGQFQSLTFQHVSFFNVAAMAHALKRAGLELADIDYVSMDGGSMVVYARKQMHKTYHSNSRVGHAMRVEAALRLQNVLGYKAFFERVVFVCQAVREYLVQSTKMGLCVGAYGAGGKGQALLNMIGPEAALIAYALDDTPGNAGKFIPGVAVPVITSSDSRAQSLDVILISAPTHVQEIVRKAAERLPNGTQFLATAPDFHCVVR